MASERVASVGGKDLQDFKSLSRAPELNYLQKQSLPEKARVEPSPVKTTIFQHLAEFSASDYVRWFVQYCQHRIGFKHPFPIYDDPARDNGIYPLGEGVVRVAIAGDWGTGTDEAFTVAELMTRRDPHFTIHLGDVYFVGDALEVKENYLGVANPRHDYTPCTWPQGSVGSFALNGNHEMYARGYGYFDLILKASGMKAPGPGHPQKASYFCLENAHWRVIALDTGYNAISVPLLEQIVQPTCALPEPLVDWLRDVLKQGDDQRGIVLLSHHQYYSRYDDGFTRAAEQLAEFIDRPVLWLWGHEHRMAIYGKRQVGAAISAYGRCIGHGGMPVDLPPAKPPHEEIPVEFVDCRLYANDEDLKVGVNGFAALTFEGDTLKIEYEDVYGAVIYSEAWKTADEGGLTRLAP